MCSAAAAAAAAVGNVLLLPWLLALRFMLLLLDGCKCLLEKAIVRDAFLLSCCCAHIFGRLHRAWQACMLRSSLSC